MIIFNLVVVIVDLLIYNNINIIIKVDSLGDTLVSDINVLLEKAVNETTKLFDGEVFCFTFFSKVMSGIVYQEVTVYYWKLYS